MLKTNGLLLPNYLVILDLENTQKKCYSNGFKGIFLFIHFFVHSTLHSPQWWNLSCYIYPMKRMLDFRVNLSIHPSNNLSLFLSYLVCPPMFQTCPFWPSHFLLFNPCAIRIERKHNRVNKMIILGVKQILAFPNLFI